MPYRKVKAAEGEIFHLYNRGALKTTLFFNAQMYEMFIDLLNTYSALYHISVIAVCLMPNHFHLGVRVEQGGDVSKFMQCLCCTYSKRTNARLRRSGTIFQGRYHMKHVKTDSYLRCLIMYIHANPIKAGLADAPLHWPYTNYAEIYGLRQRIATNVELARSINPSRIRYDADLAAYIKRNQAGDPELGADLASMGLE
jgi:putative transposase